MMTMKEINVIQNYLKVSKIFLKNGLPVNLNLFQIKNFMTTNIVVITKMD